MELRRLGAGQVRAMLIGVAVLGVALVPMIVSAQAKAASPVLEFTSASALPISFTADGGEVTAALAEFEGTVVHCTDSKGDGVILGPRSTVSDFSFTGCKAEEGPEDGFACQTEGADAEEIRADDIEADLVYIDQAKHQVGMLLNPSGGIYMTFKCGGELVEASGPFLSPVGPVNKQAASFTATLSRVGAVQTLIEYENALGERRQAIPMAKREKHPALATTGVELGFAIQTAVPLQIKAVSAAEIEARQREDESRQREDEAAAAAARKLRQEEEAVYRAAVIKRLEAEAQLEQLRRSLLSNSLKQCRETSSKHKRVRCEKRVKKKYGGATRKP